METNPNNLGLKTPTKIFVVNKIMKIWFWLPITSYAVKPVSYVQKGVSYWKIATSNYILKHINLTYYYFMVARIHIYLVLLTSP